MKHIKKYMTEDAFAQAENIPGHPYSSMTTEVPGMAYVKENMNVYFNTPESKTEFKYYYYFSGFTDVSCEYDAETGESRLVEGDPFFFIFPSSAQPVSEFYCGYAGSFSFTDCDLVYSSGQTFPLNTGGYLALAQGDGDYEYTVVDQMYTLGETLSADSQASGYYDTWQIFYLSGDTSNTKYYAWLGDKSYNIDAWYEQRNLIQLQILSGGTFPSGLGLLPLYLLKIEDNWPTVYRALPTCIQLLKEYYDNSGEDVQYTTTFLSNNFVGVEKAGEDTYKVLSLNNFDVSSQNLTITLGEYWGVAVPEVEEEFHSSNPSLSAVMPRKNERGEKKLSAASRNEGRVLGASYDGYNPYSEITALTKFVTDDQVYTASEVNENTGVRYDIRYKIFYDETDTGHEHPFYSPILNSYHYGSSAQELIAKPVGPFIYRNLEDAILNYNYNSAGFIFRLTVEDSDMFNQTVPEDIDPDWPDFEANSQSGPGYIIER